MKYLTILFCAGSLLCCSVLSSCNSGGGGSNDDDLLFVDEFSPLTVDQLTLEFVDQTAGSLVSMTFDRQTGVSEVGSVSERGTFTYSNLSSADSFSDTFTSGEYLYRVTSSGRGRVIITNGQSGGRPNFSDGSPLLFDSNGAMIPAPPSNGATFLGDSIVPDGTTSAPDLTFFTTSADIFNPALGNSLPALVIELNFVPAAGDKVDVVSVSYRIPDTVGNPEASSNSQMTSGRLSFNGRDVPARYAGTVFDPNGQRVTGPPVFSNLLPTGLGSVPSIVFELPSGDITYTNFVAISPEPFSESGGYVFGPTGATPQPGSYIYARNGDGLDIADVTFINQATGVAETVTLTFTSATAGTYTAAQSGGSLASGSTFRID